MRTIHYSPSPDGPGACGIGTGQTIRHRFAVTATPDKVTCGSCLLKIGRRKNPAAVALGRKGGKVRSEAKTDAARANGRKGGRPRKVIEPPTP